MDIKITSVSYSFELKENVTTGYKSLLAAKDFSPNVALSEFGHEESFKIPDRHSIQVDHNQHITLQPDYLKYINHSCNPNVFFDLENRTILSLRAIKKGEEIAFFYPSTEWEMTEPFDCGCGSDNCLSRIEGAASLNPEIFGKFRFSNHVNRQYNKQQKTI